MPILLIFEVSKINCARTLIFTDSSNNPKPDQDFQNLSISENNPKSKIIKSSPNSATLIIILTTKKHPLVGVPFRSD